MTNWLSRSLVCILVLLGASNSALAIVASGLNGVTETTLRTSPGVMVDGIDHDGVGDMITSTNSGSFRSTASLLWTGQHLLTAAHSVTDNTGAIDLSTSSDSTVTFELASGNQQYTFRAGAVTVHPSYNGLVSGGFDVAVINLGQLVSANVPRYDVFDGNVGDIIDVTHTKIGYGRSGDGTSGDVLGSGIKRAGNNTYDAITSNARILFDFDDGTTAHDFFGQNDPQFADLGIGDLEASSAPGDSGGPTFVDDPDDPGNFVIAGVTSFGTRSDLSDIDSVINSSFGELAVDANVTELAEWIRANVPEPSASPLILGLLLVMQVYRQHRH